MQADIKAGQADLFHACRHSLAHGVLLALHYLAPLVPWAGAVGDQAHAAAMRPWLQCLLQLLEEASELALEHLSKPQDSNIGEDHTHNHNFGRAFLTIRHTAIAPKCLVQKPACTVSPSFQPGPGNIDGTPEGHGSGICVVMPCNMTAGAEEVDADDMEAQVEDIPTEDGEGEGEGELAPQAQVILTGCWLTMKEVSLLMGSLATYAPLPGTCQSWLTHSNWPQVCQATDVCTAIAGRQPH